MEERERQADVLVVGAGAAGLWAAARAAELGRDVVLLEKTPRTGTKVLASGGTRCNLTTTLGPDEAARLFGQRGARFLAGAFRALPPLEVRRVFHGLGVATVEQELEKVFPASGRAREVRDALEAWALRAGVRILRDFPVLAVERAPAGWIVRGPDRLPRSARELVLAPGGMSYPRTGTTGDGYAWLTALGLPLVEPVPALVPLRSPDLEARGLAGVALQAASAALLSPEGVLLGRRRRPVLFTHAGLSGPGALDLSEPVAREEARAVAEGRAPRPHRLVLDLAPDVPREELRGSLLAAGALAGGPRLANRLPAELGLPRRIVLSALRRAGLGEETRANELPRDRRHALVEALKGLSVPVDGTLGFERAEVTAGGLALSAVDPRTMRVQGCAGLLVCGELLDLAGPIGGLNFQSAFATAELAARELARARAER